MRPSPRRAPGDRRELAGAAGRLRRCGADVAGVAWRGLGLPAPAPPVGRRATPRPPRCHQRLALVPAFAARQPELSRWRRRWPRPGRPARGPAPPAASRRQSSNSGRGHQHPPVERRDLHRHACRRGSSPRPASGPARSAPAAGCAARWWWSSRRRPGPPRRVSPAGASAETVKAGRPFFIMMGALQASTAPAANRAASSGSMSCGLMSSMLRLEQRHRRGAESGSGSPSGSPSTTRSTLGRSASSRVPAPSPWRGQPQRGHGAEAVDHRRQDGGAGGGGQLALPFCPDRRAGEQLGGRRAPGPAPARAPCAPIPLPTTTGLALMAAGASQAMAAAAPDDVGDRVVGPDLVKGDAVDRHPVQGRLGLRRRRAKISPASSLVSASSLARLSRRRISA